MVRTGTEQTNPDDASDAHMSYRGGRILDPQNFDADGELSTSQRMKIDALLGAW